MFYLVFDEDTEPVNVDNWPMVPVFSTVTFDLSGNSLYVVVGYMNHVKPDETTDTYVYVKDREEWEREQHKREFFGKS